MPDRTAATDSPTDADARHRRSELRRRGGDRGDRAQQLWVARDLLAAHVREERDVEALRLLGEVHHGMGDLPAAGAAWFGAGVKGPEVEAAVGRGARRTATTSARCGARCRARCARSRAPRRSRRCGAKALEARTAAGEAERPGRRLGSAVRLAVRAAGIDAAQIIAWVIAAFVVVCAIVGLVADPALDGPRRLTLRRWVSGPLMRRCSDARRRPATCDNGLQSSLRSGGSPPLRTLVTIVSPCLPTPGAAPAAAVPGPRS